MTTPIPDSRCVQISMKSAAGKWAKRVVLMIKRSENAVFSAPIALFG